MNQTQNSFGRMLLKGLIALCLALTPPLVVPILLQVSGIAPDILSHGGGFLGDQMMIAVGILLGVALLAGLALRTTGRRQPARSDAAGRGMGWFLAWSAISIVCTLAAITFMELNVRRSVLNERYHAEFNTYPVRQSLEVIPDHSFPAGPPQFRWQSSMGPKIVLLGGTGVFVIAAMGMLALMALGSRRRDRRIPNVTAGKFTNESAAPGLGPEMTFYQCAMKIQFKLTHLEEKVNDLETVLMRRAADLE